jgi:hypothetical protein
MLSIIFYFKNLPTLLPQCLEDQGSEDFLSDRRAAHEWAACLKKAQSTVHLAGDADSHSLADRARLPDLSPKPKRTVGTQVHSIQPLVDLQGSRKAPRPSRQISQFVGLAEPFHYVNSFKRLNGPQ